jgi:hypothetical protein
MLVRLFCGITRKYIRNMTYDALTNTAVGLDKNGTDVWNIFTPLANRESAINLGQGFPSYPISDFIKVRVYCSILGC